jgi:hypothetical protein
MNELKPRQVFIDDPFSTPRLVVNARKAIFHQWEQLEVTRCIDCLPVYAPTHSKPDQDPKECPQYPPAQ